ncbi:BZ3500_MvSof-1268-A1-R1_Chr2-3g05324 [Microbotryum saponariae]|uniref:BZ3500_MvSof-1268-A1-R1_Chr2-3g05324 protein n=1 Tax=Microbotryum saponariae TaxID=289078 RepID=A0A2X0KBC0_9BASI|nr:BZ3500_MvSof-1268-A1-R1_Chr2-3g05324 [Microbotryum saponariae]SDA01200.1 BZ3501_MvSof-1269-A2-R1_Chr2-2g04997 [Microbotryum saponariae]
MRTAKSLAVDDITIQLDKVPFSLPVAALIALVSFHRQRQVLGPQLQFLDHIRSTRWLRWFLTFVVIKSANRFLGRMARNNGYYAADPPRWSRVKGKGDVVLITGGSTGIGKEVVELLVKKTNKIVVFDMAEPTYNAASGVHFFKVDITDPEAIAVAAQKVRAEVGHPTIILAVAELLTTILPVQVNNAGIIHVAPLLKVTPASMKKVFAVNVMGAHNILREFLPHLIAINHGHVLTTASSAAYASVCESAAYSCSKAAVLALHETTRAELVHRYKAPKVRVSIVCPTKVATPLGEFLEDKSLQFLFPTISPKWLADKMTTTIESGLSEHLVLPHYASLLPGLRFFPEWFRWVFEKAGSVHSMTSEARTANTSSKIYTFAKTNFDDRTE